MGTKRCQGEILFKVLKFKFSIFQIYFLRRKYRNIYINKLYLYIYIYLYIYRINKKYSIHLFVFSSYKIIIQNIWKIFVGAAVSWTAPTHIFVEVAHNTDRPYKSCRVYKGRGARAQKMTKSWVLLPPSTPLGCQILAPPPLHAALPLCDLDVTRRWVWGGGGHTLPPVAVFAPLPVSRALPPRRLGFEVATTLPLSQLEIPAG
jgi:hypothetical protein